MTCAANRRTTAIHGNHNVPMSFTRAPADSGGSGLWPIPATLQSPCRRAGPISGPAPRFFLLRRTTYTGYSGPFDPSGTNHTSTRRFCDIEAASDPVATIFVVPAERVVTRDTSTLRSLTR